MCRASVDAFKYTVNEPQQLQLHNPASTQIKTCNSRQLAFDLTYEYHCTVGAVCLLAEGEKEQMNLEQKESYIEEKLAIAGSYLQ